MSKSRTHTKEELEFIKSHFYHIDGVLYRIKVVGGKHNKITGQDKHGYIRANVFGKAVFGHKIVWFLETGEWPMLDIDHINGDKSNNNPKNLRLVSARDNNRAFVKSVGSSEYRGVSWLKGAKKWVAQITNNHKYHYLGLHKTEEEAARAYNEAAIRFGFSPEALNKLD